jgi:lysylphosphatidylglycerol synthetase-like protein (DUF2156 family)
MSESKEQAQDITKILVTSVAVMGATYLATYLLRKSWKAVKKSEPPTDITSSHVSTADALAWTVLSSLVVGIATMATKKASSKLLS